MTMPHSQNFGAADLRYAIQFVNRWLYSMIGLGGRALLSPLHPPQGYGGRAQHGYGERAAPVAALGRCGGVGARSDFFP